jgi:hypothetical protein
MRKKACVVCGEALTADEKGICGYCDDENIPIKGVKHAQIRKENVRPKRRKGREKEIKETQ